MSGSMSLIPIPCAHGLQRLLVAFTDAGVLNGSSKVRQIVAFASTSLSTVEREHCVEQELCVSVQG